MNAVLQNCQAAERERVLATKAFSTGSTVFKGVHRFELYFMLLLLVACCLCVQAQSQTYTVTTLNATGPGSLASSILFANTNSGAQIVFGVAGTITIINSFPVITNNLSIIGPSNVSITISGGSTVPLFTIASSGIVVLSNMVLVNGSTNSTGAAVNNMGTISIANCVFSNNAVTSGSGGAINNAGVTSIASCLFSNNFATNGSGGAIINAGTMTIVSSVFGGNQAASGGAIENSGNLTISDSQFAGNQAENGGAVWSTGTMALQRLTIFNNLATLGFGGGILSSGSLQISASTFFNNQAVTGNGQSGEGGGGGGLGAGGAIFISTGSLTVTNCTLSENLAIGGAGANANGILGSVGGQGGGNGAGNGSGNGYAYGRNGSFGGGGGGGGSPGGSGGFGGGNGGSAGNGGGGGSGLGGAIFVESGNIWLVNNTIANNSTTAGQGGNGSSYGVGGSPGQGIGGGIYNYGGAVSLLNMIVASNNPTASSPDLVGTFVSSGYDLIGNSQGATNLNPNDYQNVAAHLGPLQNNGGPTLTCALLPTSPAIGSGTSVGAPPTDQRGIPRPENSVDMGAFQTVSTPVIATQPQSETNFVGATTSFMVLASGAGSFNCQWMKNSSSLPNDARISVNTTSSNVQGNNYSIITSTLTISNLEITDDGIYSVVISNSTGVATSSNAALTVAVPLTVEVQASPTNEGSVSGGGSYATGSTATVTAAPNTCYSLVNWTSGGIQVSTSPSYTFTVVSNETLVANFSPLSYAITEASSPSTGGTTTGGGTVNCGANATVMASANPCYTFANWTDGATVVSTSLSYTFTPSGNETLTANFSPITYTINTSSSPSAGGSTSGGGTVNCGTSVTLTATANALYSFANWTDQSGTVVSTTRSYTFTASGNETFVANFFTLAERELPTGNWQGVGYWPNYKMVYTIQAAPPSGTLSYAVQEQVLSPTNAQGSNFVISSISESGTFDKVNSLIKFGPFFDDMVRTLTYELTPPPDATNNVKFAGVMSIDGTNYTVSGPGEINLLPLHPADNSPPIENAININDVTAYGSAWKLGATWPILPNPIPIGYVTSAGLIWKSGEYYVYNAYLGAPPSCWVPTNTPVTPARDALIKDRSRSSAKAASPEILAAKAAVSVGTAVSSMPNVYTVGVPLTVTLTIKPASSVQAYAVQDQIPDGWTATNYSDNGGAFDAVNNEVKWGPFFDNSNIVLTYQVIPPANADSVVTFDGTASFDGVGVPITGTRQTGPDLPPSIIVQPTSQTAATGSTAILAVTAEGLLPLSYQWLKNSAKIGNSSRISGATSNTLTIRNLASTDKGSYSVTIANSLGRVTSTIATLDIVAPPTIGIVSPKKNATESGAVLMATGVAGSKLDVAEVFYQLNTNGWVLAQTGNGWTNWSANVTLAPGSNKLAAYAVDSLGNSSLTNTVNFTYVLSARVIVQINGKGTVSPNYNDDLLEIGKTFSMTATAGSGFKFTNWSGSVPTNKAKVTFVMESNLIFIANFLDVTRPVNVIRYPAVGQKLTNSVLIATGGAKDNVAVEDVFYQLDGAGWNEASTTNKWTNWFTPYLTLSQGSNSIQTYAVDAAGNRSPTNTIKFTASLAPQANSISTDNPSPFSVLVITGASFDPTNQLSVRFYNSQGYSLTVPVFTASSNSVSVIVPPFLDGASQDFTNGIVSVQIIQTSGTKTNESNPIGDIAIADMPALTMPPGTISANLAGFLALYLPDVEAKLQAAQVFTGNEVATSTVQSDLQSLTTNLTQLQNLILAAIANTNQAATIGVFSGVSVTLNQTTLRQCDQLILAMLQQASLSAAASDVRSSKASLNETYPDSATPPVTREDDSSCSLSTSQVFDALINGANSGASAYASYATDLQQCAAYYRTFWAPEWGQYSTAMAVLSFIPIVGEGSAVLAGGGTMMQLLSLGLATQLDSVASSLNAGDPNALKMAESDWDETLNQTKCAIVSMLLGQFDKVTPGVGKTSSLLFDLITTHFDLCGTDVPSVVDEANTYANAHDYFTLSISTTGGTGTGSVSAQPPGPTYASGTQVQLTETPNLGSLFITWTGAVTGTETSVQITMNMGESVNAVFANIEYTLNINSIGTGSGSVTANPPGPDYPYGTSVTLTANPSTGSSFDGWAGAATGSGSAKVEMTQNQSVTATFDATSYTLAIQTAGSGSGTVTASPSGGPYSYGTIVTLTANPASGSTFGGWSGAATGTGQATIIMAGNQSVTATFTTTNGGGGGVSTYNGTYSGTTSVSIPGSTSTGTGTLTVTNGYVTDPTGSFTGNVDSSGNFTGSWVYETGNLPIPMSGVFSTTSTFTLSGSIGTTVTGTVTMKKQ